MSDERSPAPREPRPAPGVSLAVSAALLVLSGLSIWLAHLDLRGWNVTAGLLIAVVQAVLIAAFSMRLRYTIGMPRLVALAALFWLGILMVGTLDDVLTRGWLPVPGK
jgi:caa(3)-type oxidase subunit IV